MSDDHGKYWEKHYHDTSVVGNDNFRKNVERTKKGIPISDEDWAKTINYIEKILSIDASSDVIELCCGNGEIIGNIAKDCREATGIDFSKVLLGQMKSRYGNLVNSIYANVLDIELANNSADAVIIYFSIQLFNERETIQLVEKSLKALRKNGRLLIGDVPNELKKWDYINKAEYRRDYIKRELNNTPMVGFWYQPAFFEALADYFDDITVKVMDQPDYQINSSHRFDVLIEKK